MLPLKLLYGLVLFLPCFFEKSLGYELPCNYMDSVNITNGVKANGSYKHDGITYPMKYVGSWDYEDVNSTFRRKVPLHLRGCICKIKKCIRMCCENSMQYDPSQYRCNEPSVNVSSIISVVNPDKTSKDVDAKSFFGFVYGIPCTLGYFLTTDIEDKWDLLDDGTIHRAFDDAYIDKDHYCLGPTLEVNQTVMYLNPLMCFQEEDQLRFRLYGIALFVSVPFMAITILIYLAIPELRNLHGKSLCCYLSALTTGDCCLGYILLADKNEIEPGGFVCKMLGFLAYYSFMASFLWLSIISFDLWWNFRGMGARSEKSEWRRFGVYSLYSWGIAFLFLIMAIVLQNSNMPDDMKPGIGGGNNCFLNVETWMQLLYFYGQLLLTISVNSTVFVLTLRKIHRVNKELNTMIAKGESGRNYNREKSRIMLFLRLFIVMGVTWTMELLAWICGHKYEAFFYITDICNAVIGMLIFIFFVLRKRVKVLLVQRYHTLRGIQGKQSWSSTRSYAIPMRSESSNNQESERESLKKETYTMAKVMETDSQVSD